MTEVPIIWTGKSMNWFLYGRDLRHESVKRQVCISNLHILQMDARKRVCKN